MYDVIVVGAGPTGATAAKILAENGCKVLLTEKFKLPRYKSCSGVLIQKSLNLIDKYFGKAVPESALCAPIGNKGMVITADTGREMRFETTGLNVWRDKFDYFLVEEAVKCGADISEQTTVTECKTENGIVYVSMRKKDGLREEKARYVIDCEGVVGTLKKRLTGEKTPYITTFQTFNRGAINLDPRYFYAYLQPELSEYDAWFNVKDEFIVLGVAVKNRKLIPYYYARFTDYMKKNCGLRIDEQVKTEKWLMPRVYPELKLDIGMGRILFAGECAGFLNPMGEGVSAGMESGFLAANAVCDGINKALTPEAVRENYAIMCEPLKGYMIRQWELAERLRPDQA